MGKGSREILMKASPHILFWQKGMQGLASPLNRSFYEGSGISPSGSEDGGGWVRAGQSGRDEAVIRVCGNCSTAFDVALWLEERGLFSDWDSVLAESQSAGVGQYGRHWISPLGNLHLVWKLPGFFSEVKGLPLMLGAALTEVLRQKGVPLLLKWPNDLILEERKVGGMLIRSRPDCVLAGMGINLVSAPSDREIRKNSTIAATSLNEKGFFFHPLDLWVDIMGDVRVFLSKSIEKISDYGLMTGSTHWLWRKGQAVMVFSSGGLTEGLSFPAVLIGPAGDGGLRLLSEKGEIIFYSGSIGPA
ncbi:BirA family biotin operon repressor/biotin-[acetyl-CoA-carboxylase] ligase [Desulfobotulus alkaliphilus]|uniref:BirA family biotin operon repressor/biotin-[acetyl-CoA-carboxylase] ligase n=2 Tax=Desulfobotulus alkaliphilus TaxID=622671 RepID=A0A562RMM1_9BACT|nr:BirA family biotin operon repressor/biotin-[acetyl-CoA-carboxylase] ligase [Desulfobotulus alkaliphilus]